MHLGFTVDLLSAVLGMVGTWLMSRRYARHFLRTLFFSLLSVPFFWRARDFFTTNASINKEVPDAPADIALGLNLLFWAFFLQLLAKFLG